MLREASQNNTAKPLSHSIIYRYAITVKGDFFLSLGGFYLCIGIATGPRRYIDEELETRPCGKYCQALSMPYLVYIRFT